MDRIRWLLCRLLSSRLWLFVLALLVLLALWLLRRWLLTWLIALVAVLVVIALLCLSRVIADLVASRCRKQRGDPKGQGSLGSVGRPKIKIPSHTYKRPDPLIYSQHFLMSQGFAVTWDNPDIWLERLGVPVSSSDLKPATDYVIKAQVWNGSTDAPAVNVLVQFSFLTFGVGTISTSVGDTLITLPVKGALGLPAVAEMPWRTPASSGHYCIQVALVWPDDANPFNNLGQENVNVKALNSPSATFEFVLRNDGPVQRTFRLETDGYSIPLRPPCDELLVGEIDAIASRESHYTRHLRRSNPLPPGWNVEFTPSASVALAPGREQMMAVAITSAGEPVAKQAINVNAFVERSLVGGVTFYVHS